MCPSLKDHVSTLLQPLIYELIARLCGLARFTAAGQEYPPFFIFDGHEIGRYLYVDDIGTVGVRTEIVHEQVMCVVDKEVQCVHHLTVVADEGHLDGLFYDLRYRLLSSLLFLKKLNLHLLLRLFKEELGFANDLFALFQCLLNLAGLLKHADIIAIRELLLLLLEESSADVCFLVELFSLELNVDEVSLFEKTGKLIKLGLLKNFKLLVKRIEEVNNTLTKLILEIELLALNDLLATLNQVVCSFIDVLQEVLRCCFQKEDLVVMVSVVGQVTAFFANELVVQAAVGYITATMVRAESQLARPRILLVRLLLLGRLSWIILTRMLLHHHLLVSRGVCISKLLVLVSLPFRIVRLLVLRLNHVAGVRGHPDGATMYLLLSGRLNLGRRLRLRGTMSDIIGISSVGQTV